MHTDHRGYAKYMTRAVIEKAVNSLIGILQGISIDNAINATEIQYLEQWINEHEFVADRYPFNELLPKVTAAIADGVLTAEEKDDVMWLCNKLQNSSYYDQVTTDLQLLQGIVGSIASDRTIEIRELRGLSDWLAEHDHLKKMWPFDEIESLVTGVLADKQISSEEQLRLQEFFEQFAPAYGKSTVDDSHISKSGTLVGLCAVCPEVSFEGSTFCFTGTSPKYTRDTFETLVFELGGQVSRTVTKKLQYLVIGAAGNPFWAYACYGRKVEQAVHLRKNGHQMQIIHENDFHDAVADLR